MATERSRIRRSRLSTGLEDVLAHVCGAVDNARNSGVQDGLQRRGRHGTREVEPRQDLGCHMLVLRSTGERGGVFSLAGANGNGAAGQHTWASSSARESSGTEPAALRRRLRGIMSSVGGARRGAAEIDEFGTGSAPDGEGSGAESRKGKRSPTAGRGLGPDGSRWGRFGLNEVGGACSSPPLSECPDACTQAKLQGTKRDSQSVARHPPETHR